MENMDIKTLHGHIFTCNKCNKFHFEFNQIAIDFSSLNILENFHNYLDKIDIDEFERINRHSQYTRKIQIPFPGTSIKMVLSKIDLKELKVLISTFVKDYKIALKEKEMINKLYFFSEIQRN